MNELKWHKYPEEQPKKEGKYLVCCPLGMIPDSPVVSVAYWGKSEECEWYDKYKSLEGKKAYWYCTSSGHGDYTIDDVYAWMQLPDPMPLPDERKETKDERRTN